jgi:hypothetical protein
MTRPSNALLIVPVLTGGLVRRTRLGSKLLPEARTPEQSSALGDRTASLDRSWSRTFFTKYFCWMSQNGPERALLTREGEKATSEGRRSEEAFSFPHVFGTRIA